MTSQPKLEPSVGLACGRCIAELKADVPVFVKVGGRFINKCLRCGREIKRGTRYGFPKW